MSPLHRRAGAVLSLAVLLTVAGAAAAEPPPKGDPRRDAALQEGKKLVDEKSWSKAAKKFREAIGIRSDPKAILLLGLTQEKLGNLLDAKALYTQALKDAQEEKRKPDEKEAQKALAALEPTIPRLDIHVPKGMDSAVYVDEALVTLKQGKVEVNPGSHSVTVSAPGRKAYHTKTEVKLGQVQSIEAELPEAPPEPPPAPPPSASSPSEPPPPESTSSSTGPVILGITGGGAVLAGLALFIAGRSQEDPTSPLPTAGIVMMIGGGVVGVAGLTWGLVTLKKKPPPASTPQARAEGTARAPVLNAWILPSARGAYAGIGGQF